MTSQVVPAHPESAEEVAESSLSIISLAWRRTPVRGTWLDVPLKIAMWEGANCKVCRKVMETKSVVPNLVRDGISRFENQYVNLRRAFVNDDTEVLTFNQGNQSIPRNFVLLESADYIQWLNFVKHFLRTEKLVVFDGHVDQLVHIPEFSVSANLNRLVTPTVRAIMESGIFQKWQVIENMHWEPRLSHWAKWHYPDLVHEKTWSPALFNLPSPSPRPQKGSVHSYRVPMLVFCMLISVSTFVLYLEVVQLIVCFGHLVNTLLFMHGSWKWARGKLAWTFVITRFKIRKLHGKFLLR
jgi:uncharacterized membrane protein (DUF485 family)